MGIDQREEEKAMLIDKKKKFVIQFQFPQIARKVKKSPRTKPVSLFLSVFFREINKKVMEALIRTFFICL